MKTVPLFDSYSLRLLIAEDADAIFTAIDTQRAYLGRWLPFVATTHQVGQTREVVTAMLTNTANPIYTIRCNGLFAGLIGFKSANPQKRCIEIGYWLCEEHQGRGVMSSAVQALCREAFATMNMQRVEIRCATGNQPSNRIPQRLGFRLETVEVRGEELTGGVWTDLNLYVLEP